MDTEIPEEDAVWRGAAGAVGDNQGTAPIQKDRGGGRRDVRRPHTPEREDSAEGERLQCDGVCQGEERAVRKYIREQENADRMTDE